MKWIIIFFLAFLVGCSGSNTSPRPEIVGAESLVSKRGEVIPRGPIASLEPIHGLDIAQVTETASIQGRYFSQGGGAFSIDTKGIATIEGLFGLTQSKAPIQTSPQGSSLTLEGGKRLAVSRILIGLDVGGETLIREDGRTMFSLPHDSRLVGRFVSKSGGEIVSSDGRYFDYLPSDTEKTTEWRRYTHPGNYSNGATPNQQTVSLRWINQLSSSEPLTITLSSDNALRVGDEIFNPSQAGDAALIFGGSFKDTLGNHIDLSNDGRARFSLSFPGKANRVTADGRAKTLTENLVGVVSEEIGKPFGFSIRKLSMGHVLVYLPDAAGAGPLMLFAPLDRRVEPSANVKQGLYLDTSAYSIELKADDKLVMTRKPMEVADTHQTPGAIVRRVIGAEIYPKGAARIYYSQGPSLLALYEETENQTMLFYPADYRGQLMAQSDGPYAHIMRLTQPEDGFKHAPVPTLEYGDTHLRHYPSAYKDIVADTYEDQQRKRDHDVAAAMEADPSVQLAKEDGQAERERRMRRREDGRNEGDPTPKVGAFYISQHSSRVMEMERLRQELAGLPLPRNASELRANITKEKRIRARASQLSVEDKTESDSAPR